MAFKDLEAEGLIRPFRATPEQIRGQLSRAQKDLSTATRILREDPEWAQVMAYNAVRRALTGAMYSNGYRPREEKASHVAVIRFAREVLGAEWKSDLEFADRMRRRRHQFMYEQSGASQKEAKEALEFARGFVNRIQEWITRQGQLV